MALGFLKKVFSFGKKEVVVEPPAEEKLAPLNLDALEALKREEPVAPVVDKGEPAGEASQAVEPSGADAHPPLEGEGGRTAAGWGEVGAPEALAPSGLRPDTSPIDGEKGSKPAGVQLDPGSAEPEPAPQPPQPTPGPETPQTPPPETEPEPAPAIPAPAPETPRPSPAPEIEPEPTPVTPAPVPQEVPPTEPAGPVEIPHEPARPTPEIEPEPASPAPQPAPPEVPASDRPAEIPHGRSTPAGKITVARKIEQKAEPQPVAPAPAPRVSWFQRLREGLSRSSRELTGNVAGLFTKRRLDEDTLQDLEDVLIRADLGVETALRITDALSAGRYGKNVSDDEVRAVMAEEIGKVLAPVAQALELDLSHKPHVILVVGVNGTGKTTTIGKLAAKLSEGGLSVMLGAGDTFRAAAIEQLKIWGERTGSPVVSSKLGADAAGLAYDAFEKAKAAGSDVLIIDTAGRLQNKTELMAELEKIVRVLGKLDPEAPHTVLQTVDATTGQNALNQVEIFRNVAGVNGLVMTKLDGTARGGILVGIAAKYKLPVYFIGVGEQVDDLEPFSAGDFAKAIAGVG